MSNQSLTAEKEWLKTVEQYRRLGEFGFVESHPVDQTGRSKEARFSSQNFIFVISVDLLLGEQHALTVEAETGITAIPNPQLALCYFLPDTDKLIARYEGAESMEQEFDVTLNLYRENPWVIQTKAWIRNTRFLDAIEKTNQWVWKEMQGGIRPLKRWEIERVLHSYRDPNTQIPGNL